MRLNPFLLAAACLILPARAEEPPLRDLLRDGLYAEEVTRDSAAAAKHYEQVLTRYADQRAFAASALFRLAEVRRKQNRKDDAIQLYQRLLVEFPGAEAEANLARESLAALGGKLPETNEAPTDDETKELTRLQATASSSPDVLLDPDTLKWAVSKGWTKVVKFLLAAGNRDEGKALQNAAQKGNLEMIKLLLADGGPVPDKVATGSIMEAIDNKRYTALDFLLKAGLRPGRLDEGKPVLAQALLGDQYAAAEVLLKHGADLHEMVIPNPSDYLTGGTSLHLCIRQGKLESVIWLLEKGAKPDLPTPRFGLTPLHMAVIGEQPGMLAIMEKLLDAGADPNHVSGPEIDDDTSRPALNATPLETAIVTRALTLEKVALLLKHGGKTDRKDSRAASMLGTAIWNNHPGTFELTRLLGEAGMSMKLPWIIQGAAAKGDPELLSLVLKYGADPNAKDEEGRSLLLTALVDGKVAMVKALLEAGADPKAIAPDGEDLLRSAAKGSPVEVLKLLADAGLAPSPEWKADRYSGSSNVAVGFLLDRFVLPELTADAGANFVMDLGSGLETVRIWDGGAAKDPPLLARWLLDRAGKLNFAVLNLANSNRPAEYEWSICHKDGHGGAEKTRLDFAGNESFPSLKPGDVIVCRMVTSLEGYNFSWQGVTPDMEWSLKKRIAFPVTVTLAGKSREVSVRGDRLFFDPTKPEVPLVNAQQAVDFLRQPPAYAATQPGTILVKRKGWPEVRMAYGSKEAGNFQLEPGDEITLDLPPDTDAEFEKLRPLSVALKAVDAPFARSFGIFRYKPSGQPRQVLRNGAIGITSDDSEADPATLPTLIQALLETQVPNVGAWKEWGAAAASGTGDLSPAGRVFSGFTILPHPDLSRIRIHRLAEDGKETVMEIDLAATMTPDLTPEAARKADVILQGGDIVEIPLKDTNGPWKGFTGDEKRFFAKALSGKVQITDSEGKISFTEINCQSPDFIETASGWLPVPAPTGTPGARAWWMLGNGDGEFRRGDVAGRQNSSSIFLRDGDEWKTVAGSSSGGQPRQPRVTPQPQPGSSNSLPDPIR